MMNYQPQHIQKREIVDIQKIKYKYKSKKKPWVIQLNPNMLQCKNISYSWSGLNTNDSKIGPRGRDSLGMHFKYLFPFFLGLSATIPSSWTFLPFFFFEYPTLSTDTRLCGSLHGLDTFWARGLSWINKERTTTTGFKICGKRPLNPGFQKSVGKRPLQPGFLIICGKTAIYNGKPPWNPGVFNGLH